MLYIVDNSLYFYQIAEALSESLTALGVENKLVKKIDLKKEELYLLFTVNPLEFDQLPKRYIVYNYEQLTTNRVWNDDFYKKLKGAKSVWDYSLKNIKHLQEKGINAIHVPYGYSPCLEVTSSNTDKPNDILFLGTLNMRRKINLLSIKQTTYEGNKEPKLVVHQQCFKDNYDNEIQKCKMVVNIHYYIGGTILEVSRIIPLLANKCLVISEPSYDEWYDEKLKKCIKFVEVEKMPKMCKVCLDNRALLDKFVDNGYQWLKENFNYQHFIKESGVVDIITNLMID